MVLYRGVLRTARADILAAIKAPPSTKTWHPVPHVDVLLVAQQMLSDAGYVIGKQRLSKSHESKRFFGVLDLERRILDGISPAVGIRNSIDRSFPIGYCCGQRVFACDNLAFTSEIVVAPYR